MTAPQDDEDIHLMTALAGGNDPALNVLMRRWNVRLISFLYRLCGSHATACDLAQETFVRVYKHRHRFRPAQRFSTWLFAIATNLARNHARWQKRHPVTLLEPEQMLSLPLESDQACPAESLEQQERAAAVRQAVLELPADQREVLVLATYEGMSHAEIASILDTGEKAVEMRLYRARGQLRLLLTKWLAEE